MKRIPFPEFVKEKGQAEVAGHLGITQGAISKALSAGRDVYVICHEDGSYSAEELKPFPSSHAAKKSAA